GSGVDMRFGGMGRFTGHPSKTARLAGVGILVTSLAVLGGASSAAAVPTDKFTPAPLGLTIRHQPLGLSDAQTTVMVEVSGAPVTAAEADAPQPFSSSEKQTRKSQLRAQQTPVEQRIRELGGTVVGNYQSAYNGIKVRISARKASALLDIPNVIGVHRV